MICASYLESGRTFSLGLVEKRISKRVAFSDKIMTGAKFICDDELVFVGVGVEQFKVRQIAFSLDFGSADFAVFFLQHFIAQTFSFIPPSKNGVPAGTLATSEIRKNKDVSHLFIVTECILKNFQMSTAHFIRQIKRSPKTLSKLNFLLNLAR